MDPCDFCEKTADAIWVAMEERPRLVRACREHAEDAEMPVFEEVPAACGLTDPGSGPARVPCGAAVTHVLLIEIDQDDEPRVALVSSCRRHATRTDEPPKPLGDRPLWEPPDYPPGE